MYNSTVKLSVLVLEALSSLFFVTLLFACMVANAAVPASKADQFRSDIERVMFDDSYEIILAGEREVLLITQQNTTPITRGVAILLGESGNGPLSQTSLAPLTEHLNNVGWITMLMSVPDVGLDTLPAKLAEENADEVPTAVENTAATGDDTATEDATAISEDITTAPAEPSPVTPAPVPSPPVKSVAGLNIIDSDAFNLHMQQLKNQLSVAVDRAILESGFTIVIAQGTSAAWLSKIYQSSAEPEIDAMVLINPYWPQRSYNKTIARMIATTSVPVLDIYTQWDNEWGQATQKQRLISATKFLKLHYRQRELLGTAMNDQQYYYLSKEIYGWLSHMGW